MNVNSLLMVGTSYETMGGITTVVSAYKAAGLFDRYTIKYIATHCDGGPFAKLKIGILGLIKYTFSLLTGSYQIVHLHVSSRASFWRKMPFILLAKLFRKKVVFHLHGSEFRVFFDSELSPLVRKIAVWVINLPDVVLALSPSWGTWLKTCVHKPRVVVIENSIAPMSLPPSVRRRPNQLLFLGRIGERKGFWDLLQVLNQLNKSGIDFHLLAGGDGELDKARAMVEEYGLQSKVEFIGWVRDQEKLKLLAESSIFMLPSYNEGMPMSVLEALAAGLPIISTFAGGIPDQVSDGVEGYLVEAGDVKALECQLSKLLSSEDLRNRMSIACVAKFDRHFSTTVVLPKLEAIYEELLSQDVKKVL